MPTPDSGTPQTIQFLTLIRTNGGQHQSVSPSQLWQHLQQNVKAAGLRPTGQMAPFTNDAKLAIMGEAKSYEDVARFAYVCSEEGLNVETVIGFKPEIVEQEVRQLAGSSTR